MFVAALVSVVAPWDALICTSKCVLVTVKRVFDTETDFLNDRFGVNNKFIYPELPIIPLGIDVKEFDFSEEYVNELALFIKEELKKLQ